MRDPQAPSKTVRLFRDNRSQALRIPVEFELPGREATIKRDGNRLIVEPVRPPGLVALLDRWEPLDEVWLEVDDTTSTPEEIF